MENKKIIISNLLELNGYILERKKAAKLRLENELDQVIYQYKKLVYHITKLENTYELLAPELDQAELLNSLQNKLNLLQTELDLLMPVFKKHWYDPKRQFIYAEHLKQKNEQTKQTETS